MSEEHLVSEELKNFFKNAINRNPYIKDEQRDITDHLDHFPSRK